MTCKEPQNTITNNCETSMHFSKSTNHMQFTPGSRIVYDTTTMKTSRKQVAMTVNQVLFKIDALSELSTNALKAWAKKVFPDLRPKNREEAIVLVVKDIVISNFDAVARPELDGRHRSKRTI